MSDDFTIYLSYEALPTELAGSPYEYVLAYDARMAIKRALQKQSEEIQTSGWLSPAEAEGLRRKLAEVEGERDHLQTSFDKAAQWLSEVRKENVALRTTLYSHPLAAKLLRKRKKFIVVAVDEVYFRQVFDIIREDEISKGTWTPEDEAWYKDAIEESEALCSQQKKNIE